MPTGTDSSGASPALLLCDAQIHNLMVCEAEMVIHGYLLDLLFRMDHRVLLCSGVNHSSSLRKWLQLNVMRLEELELFGCDF